MKALIFGANGYFGKSISSTFKTIDIIPDTFTDITHFREVENAIHYTRPDILINAAALVDEDRAEMDIDYWASLMKVNILGAINCLKACKLNNVKYAHIKTPFEVSPIDDYSLSKISASAFIDAPKYEDMTLKILPGWAYGNGGTSQSRQFDALLIRSIKEKIPLGITNNSICCPVYMPDFCERLEKIILENKFGLQTISATESCTRFQFAECVAKVLGKTMEELQWTENNKYPELAKRPPIWATYGDLPSFKERMPDFLKANNLL